MDQGKAQSCTCPEVPVVEICGPAFLAMVPLASVTMSAYQHAPWIAQAIEGVLAQQCSFPFELIIGDDGSTDGTLEICQDYQRRHPGIIRLIIAGRNTGLKANKLRQFELVRGRYHALCDGDDWWSDPLKLQAQVDFLESHPECSLCFTRTRVVRQTANGQEEEGSIGPPDHRQVYAPSVFLADYFGHTSSLVFRKIASYPEWFWDPRCLGDVATHLLCMETGSAGFLDRFASVYRITGRGIWSGVGGMERCQASSDTYRLLRQYCREKQLPWRHAIERRCLFAEINLGRSLLGAGFRNEARQHWRRLLAEGNVWRYPGLWWRFFKLAARAR